MGAPDHGGGARSARSGDTATTVARRRVVALVDGEHYPPVVRFALDRLAADVDVIGVAFAGGTEKIAATNDMAAYGYELIRASDAHGALRAAISLHHPDEIVDLSDEPVVSASDRMRLASLALSHGVSYRGADFRIDPPRVGYRPATPTLGIIGTGKRIGKTAVSAAIARKLTADGVDLVVLAMGRGGPAEPELIRGDLVELTTEELLALARKGKHASSDNYEDAIMARVSTVGTRRCGGGLAGETFFGNVEAGAALADSLGKDLLIAEGSGAAIPPVAADATVLVVGAGQGPGYVTDFLGPFRLARADGVIVAGAEPPFAETDQVRDVLRAIESLRPGLPVSAVTFRPHPIGPVDGARVFFATTAPPAIVPALVEHLESHHGCIVVGSSSNLSDRERLAQDMARVTGYDVLLTELKAAAVDVVIAAGERAGLRTVLCDNIPVQVSGVEFSMLVGSVGDAALSRGRGRGEAR